MPVFYEELTACHFLSNQSISVEECLSSRLINNTSITDFIRTPSLLVKITSNSFYMGLSKIKQFLRQKNMENGFLGGLTDFLCSITIPYVIPICSANNKFHDFVG